MQHAQSYVFTAIVKQAVAGERSVPAYDKQEYELQHHDRV